MIMLKNENIICISSIDWDFIWQGHQEIMSTLAKNGNRVLFIENTGVRAPGIRDISRLKNRIKNWFRGVKGIRKEMDNLYVFSPLVLPFPYSRIARWINFHLILPILEKWMKVMDFSNPVVWTFLPTPLSLDIADNLVKKIVIYYCIDNFSVSSASVKKIKSSEIKLLKKADLVFVTSTELYNYCSNYSHNVYIFPFAVNFQEFEQARVKEGSFPDELQELKGPIIGYAGGVHKWIDRDLIKKTAEKYPDYSFVFVGPLQTDVSLLKKVKNVHFLGFREHQELPKYIKAFDVCVIPYLLADYTKNVYPTKLNEYLAMGKPVVSSSLPEIEAFNKKYNNIVYSAKDRETFVRYIKQAINENNETLIEKRIEVARENSWENRINKMSELIEKAIERRRLDKETRWKENLLGFYRVTRRRLARVALICLFGYLLLFRTPFIWFVASPLKIVDEPQKSDAIVVFGGGVGETGSPGKSTVERARYAVELYKQGYAKKIIFSSGYTFHYNDAENMKLFALSMGVPERNIILEQKAGSTYENVKFTEQILDRQGWDSILLVSSPYNMGRASLVFKKLADKIKVIYTPVPDSQFYDRKIGSRWQQIKAIIHEYLGILYYWLKGYI